MCGYEDYDFTPLQKAKEVRRFWSGTTTVLPYVGDNATWAEVTILLHSFHSMATQIRIGLEIVSCPFSCRKRKSTMQWKMGRGRDKTRRGFRCQARHILHVKLDRKGDWTGWL